MTTATLKKETRSHASNHATVGDAGGTVPRTALRGHAHAGAADEIPADFLRGMADCQHGRVVDMETALNTPPPKP
jgi:hypothetical protein